MLKLVSNYANTVELVPYAFGSINNMNILVEIEVKRFYN